MTRDEIFAVVIANVRAIATYLGDHDYQSHESLAELGIDSVDRAEITMRTMEALDLKVPLVEFARIRNIGELVDLFHAKRGAR